MVYAIPRFKCPSCGSEEILKYSCSICTTLYDTREEAECCEQKPPMKPKVDVGMFAKIVNDGPWSGHVGKVIRLLYDSNHDIYGVDIYLIDSSKYYHCCHNEVIAVKMGWIEIQ